jgi:uncharacterized membrane protein YqjE
MTLYLLLCLGWTLALVGWTLIAIGAYVIRTLWQKYQAEQEAITEMSHALDQALSVARGQAYTNTKDIN